MNVFPKLTWKRGGVLHSCMLEQSPTYLILVAEIVDSGDDGEAGRYGARWLAGGPQFSKAFATLELAKAWVRERVRESFGVSL